MCNKWSPHYSITLSLSLLRLYLAVSECSGGGDGGGGRRTLALLVRRCQPLDDWRNLHTHSLTHISVLLLWMTKKRQVLVARRRRRRLHGGCAAAAAAAIAGDAVGQDGAT